MPHGKLPGHAAPSGNRVVHGACLPAMVEEDEIGEVTADDLTGGVAEQFGAAFAHCLIRPVPSETIKATGNRFHHAAACPTAAVRSPACLGSGIASAPSCCLSIMNGFVSSGTGVCSGSGSYLGRAGSERSATVIRTSQWRESPAQAIRWPRVGWAGQTLGDHPQTCKADVAADPERPPGPDCRTYGMCSTCSPQMVLPVRV